MPPELRGGRQVWWVPGRPGLGCAGTAGRRVPGRFELGTAWCVGAGRVGGCAFSGHICMAVSRLLAKRTKTGVRRRAGLSPLRRPPRAGCCPPSGGLLYALAAGPPVQVPGRPGVGPRGSGRPFRAVRFFLLFFPLAVFFYFLARPADQPPFPFSLFPFPPFLPFLPLFRFCFFFLPRCRVGLRFLVCWAGWPSLSFPFFLYSSIPFFLLSF